MLQAKKDAQDVGVERGRIGLGRLLRDRAGRALGSRIVDRDIEPSEPVDRPIHQAADLILVPDVGLDEFRLRAKGANFFREFHSGVRPPAGNDNSGSRASKGQRGGAADAGECARDKNNRLG